MNVVGTTPVLRIFDVPLAKRFYVGYLGCTVDWEEGDPPDHPVYMQVSRGAFVLHLSTHHGDGTPGGVVLVEVTGIEQLHAELHATNYGFYYPGLEEGPGERMLSVTVEDPFANAIRFFERNVTPD